MTAHADGVGNGDDVTHDEVAGIALPVPEEAQADVPETVEPEEGEGRTVSTVVRDAVDAPGTDRTADDDGVGERPEAQVSTSPDAPSDSDSGVEPVAAEGSSVEQREPVASGEVPDPPDATEGPTAGGATAGVPAGAAEQRPEPAPVEDEPVDVGSDDLANTDADVPAAEAEPAPVADGEPAAATAGPTATRITADEQPPADTPTADGTPTPPDGTPASASTVVAPVPQPRAEPAYEEVTATYVVQDAPAEMSPSELRIDFGAHLEANYQRLVAQMYAITLSPDQAHSVVQDAYSRAWRNWSVIGRSADPTGWVRRVAVRTTMRSWRHVLARFGLVKAAPPVADGLDDRTTALLSALRELPAPERRSVVLFHMAGLSPGEIAAVEQVSPSTISTRLDRARRVVLGDTSDLLTGVIELPGVVLDGDRGYVDQMSMPPEVRDEPVGHLDDRWERTDAWNGGPDGSWIVSEAPPWDAPNSDEWPRTAPAGPRTGGNEPPDVRDERSEGVRTWGADDAPVGSEDGREDEPVDGTGGTPRNDSEDKR